MIVHYAKNKPRVQMRPARFEKCFFVWQQNRQKICRSLVFAHCRKPEASRLVFPSTLDCSLSTRTTHQLSFLFPIGDAGMLLVHTKVNKLSALKPGDEITYGARGQKYVLTRSERGNYYHQQNLTTKQVRPIKRRERVSDSVGFKDWHLVHVLSCAILCTENTMLSCCPVHWEHDISVLSVLSTVHWEHDGQKPGRLVHVFKKYMWSLRSMLRQVLVIRLPKPAQCLFQWSPLTRRFVLCQLWGFITLG